MDGSSVEQRIDRETLSSLRSVIKTSRRHFNDDMSTIKKHGGAFKNETSPLLIAGASFIESKQDPRSILDDYDEVIRKITNILGY